MSILNSWDSLSSSLEYVIYNTGVYIVPAGSVAASVVQCVLYPCSSLVCLSTSTGTVKIITDNDDQIAQHQSLHIQSHLAPKHTPTEMPTHI